MWPWCPIFGWRLQPAISWPVSGTIFLPVLPYFIFPFSPVFLQVISLYKGSMWWHVKSWCTLSKSISVFLFIRSHLCLCLPSYPCVSFSLLMYVTFNTPLSILTDAAASFFFAWMVTVHLSPQYVTVFFIKNDKVYFWTNVYIFLVAMMRKQQPWVTDFSKLKVNNRNLCDNK